MKLSVYNTIIKIMHTHNSRDCLPLIVKEFPDFSISTIGSIYAQDYQKKMRKTHHIHYNPVKMEMYYEQYLEGVQNKERHILLRIANEIELSPALLARMVLERYLSSTKYGGENPPRSYVTKLMKDNTLINDPVLASEIHECLVSDDHYGPHVDNIKQSIGHEHECKLNRILDSLNLTYIGEDQMRTRGFDKTPDVKLEVPFSVDGHVINWIESKASFGDEYSHKGYLKDQFWSYWNRFGPGMVIYWFGFIEELDTDREKGIILSDKFPENIVRMNPIMK